MALQFERVFGGSVKEVGDALTRWTETRTRNLGRVVENAARKTDPNGRGSVHPRAALAIIEEAGWADDEMVAEYLGGVLAGAKTEDHRDDRAVTYTAQIRRLSSYALTVHYLVYHALHKNTRLDTKHRVGEAGPRASLQVAIPGSVFIDAFQDDDLLHSLWPKIHHAGRTLVRENLLDATNGATGWGAESVLPVWARTGELVGFHCTASMDGVDLYLWGMGAGGRPVNDLFAPDLLEPEGSPSVRAIRVHPSIRPQVAESESGE